MLILFAVNLLILALVVWNARSWPKPRLHKGVAAQSCSILIPARNEENNLAGCLESAMQQGSAVLEIIVCDDHSEDGTAQVVQQYQQREPRLKLIQAGELPPGWCGKNFACASLAAQAKGEWMLFVDADVRLSPQAAEIMLAEAQVRQCSFLSCWPGLILDSFWERALMPLLNFVVFTLFPAPFSLIRNDPSLGLAHGACILIKSDEYRASGGHQLVYNEIFEDTCLARVWRQSGRQGVCLDGQDLAEVRMYDSLDGIFRGFQKNFYPAFKKNCELLAIPGLSFHMLFIAFCRSALIGLWLSRFMAPGCGSHVCGTDAAGTGLEVQLSVLAGLGASLSPNHADCDRP
jgi:glycosyltransferase involved in cell wall biosynthesis